MTYDLRKLLKQGFKNAFKPTKHLKNFTAYTLIFYILESLMNITVVSSESGKKVAALFAIVIVFAFLPILVYQLKSDIKTYHMRFGKTLDFISEILQKYLSVTETGLGLLIVYGILYSKGIFPYFFVLIFAYLYTGIILEINKIE